MDVLTRLLNRDPTVARLNTMRVLKHFDPSLFSAVLAKTVPAGKT